MERYINELSNSIDYYINFINKVIPGLVPRIFQGEYIKKNTFLVKVFFNSKTI